MSVVRFLIVLAASGGLAASAASAEPYYRVHPGDTLSALAVRFGTTVTTLERLNDITAGAPLLIGAKLETPAPSEPLLRYRVVPGDTLTGIAARFHTTTAAIIAVNGINPARPILIGATLRVPGHPVAATLAPSPSPIVYTVRPGDTLSGIARCYGVSLDALAAANNRNPAATLVIGTRLVLPAGAVADAPLTFTRSSVRASIDYWAAHYEVDPHLVAALAWMESGFNNNLVSAAGAVGVMQITPDTWSYVQNVLLLGEPVPHTSDGNVRIGVAYLHHLFHVFNGNPRLVLAAYYQGARSVTLQGFLPGTSQYVDDILALQTRF